MAVPQAFSASEIQTRPVAGRLTQANRWGTPAESRFDPPSTTLLLNPAVRLGLNDWSPRVAPPQEPVCGGLW
jgi:hypothetical protein